MLDPVSLMNLIVDVYAYKTSLSFKCVNYWILFVSITLSLRYGMKGFMSIFLLNLIVPVYCISSTNVLFSLSEFVTMMTSK